MIPPRLSAAFPPAVRARGDEYFRGHRARVASATDSELKAAVRGTDKYAVTMNAEGELIAAQCTCEYAADRGACKHIWAVIRLADHEGTLHGLLETAGKDFAFVVESGDVAHENGAQMNGAEATAARRGYPAQPNAFPDWRRMLETVRTRARTAPPVEEASGEQWPAGRRVVYIADLSASTQASGVVIELATDAQAPDGSWKPPAQFRLSTDAWRTVPDVRDREIAQMLLGAGRANAYPPHNVRDRNASPNFVLGSHALATTLPLICETGRCRVRRTRNERPTEAVRWDDGPPWQLRLRLTRTLDGYRVAGVLQREGGELPLAEPMLLHRAGVLFARGAFARFDDGGAFEFVAGLREAGATGVAERDLPAFLETLFALPRRPPIDLPADAQVLEVRTPPQPGVSIDTDPQGWQTASNMLTLFFTYGTVRVTASETSTSLFDVASRMVHHRDPVAERAARATLQRLGARDDWAFRGSSRALTINTAKTARLIFELANAGWRVEAHGVMYRTAVPGPLRVRSGIDWFALDATVSYGDLDVSLTDLLAARRMGSASIVLSDGTQGLLPLDWLDKLGPIAAGGVTRDGELRYARAQTALLDALLTTMPDADVDATFAQARAELQTFAQIAPVDPPATFQGTLREYQREGLAWLQFLRRFGLGGCLADDMGLGKTVQVLAMLDARRVELGEDRRPSLVVVPRSLVFNWLREAERFTPELRMLDYTGTGRSVNKIESADVVITTYGTLRRDAATLASIGFDYAILDEAQAIKTASSASAKAARLLRANARLALTGTPIENRLEELWSLFEFLNPGMLGQSATFAALAHASGESGAPDGRHVLARALRPVILRRTKAQVAPELPARIEQTLTVDLEGAQKTFYREMLAASRQSVLERVDRFGIGKAKMHILEALLRLRQVACHPVLADARKHAAPSAKLDALVPALEEIISEGHKALVFSQFTSFLALVRERLDAAGMTYEYLDGKTRDRQARVDRFQSDPACPLFLISLKAGGHGLNLTAADYVFILDPWWNPAVEAQAIDRAHRIGQTRHVIATRIVARNTIEEKILELQASKRALADAILGEDQGGLAGIGRAELEMLLA